MYVCHGFEEACRWVSAREDVIAPPPTPPQSAPYRGGIVAIGNFDGVHLGHRAMIAALLRTARVRQVPAVVFTFDPHPMAVIRGSAPPALATTQRKLELIAECGVDCTLVYPTDAALLNLSPGEFFDQMLVGRMHVQGLVEGSNFRFGKDRVGDVGLLRQLCLGADVTCEVVPQVQLGERVVSSSQVRSLILHGQMQEAQSLLGRPYRITGNVVAGARRGRTIGFPTANLAGVATVLPPEGVYAGQAWVDGRRYPAGINLGPNPTFGDAQQKLEVHLLDFTGDLYGQPLDVDLLERLRPTRPFGNVNELIDQLKLDMEQVRDIAD